MNTIRIALRVVGAAMMTLAVTAWAEAPTASAGGSEQNRVEYWESQGYGTCVKHDELRTRTFTVPPAPAGQVYTAAVVKAGSDVSAGQAHELDTSVAAGDVLSHSSGKELSFVILCTRPPLATMTASATPSANTTTMGSAAGGPSAASPAGASSAATLGDASSATATARSSATTTTTTTRPSATGRTAGGSDSTTRSAAAITTTGASAPTATRASASPPDGASVTTPANGAAATTTNTQVSGVSSQASNPAQEPEVAVAGTQAGVDDIAPTRSGFPLGLALSATIGLLLGGAALLLLPGRLTVHRGRHRHH